MKKFDKQDLIFYYQNYDFPKKLILDDVLIHRELLFNDKSEEPLVVQHPNKKYKYASSFIIEDEADRRKPKFQKPHAPLSNWRKNEQPDPSSGSFFDNFKGKTDEKQVKMFKLNQELQITRENNWSVIDKFESHMVEGDTRLKVIKNEPVVITTNADSLFADADSLFSTSSSSKSVKTTYDGLVFSSNLEEFNTKTLHKVNEHLQYPSDDQLWYIFHPVAKSSFGPLTTPNIEEMYNTKVINGQMEIRLIDVYCIKGKKPFTFFKLKDIESKTFLESIELSNLFKIAQKINKSDGDINDISVSGSSSVNNKTTHTVTNNVTTTNIKQNDNVIPSKPQQDSKVINKQEKKLSDNSDSIYSIVKTSPKDAKPTKLIDSKTVSAESKTDDSEGDKRKPKDKKLKGKPTDLNGVQLGMYCFNI
jgi:hypothetical protein